MVVVSWYKHAAQCPSVIAPYVLAALNSGIIAKLFNYFVSPLRWKCKYIIS